MKSSNLIYNFMKSKLWHDKIKNNSDKIILPLFLYYDDFEVNDPLGSHASIQKLGAVYVTLACLPPELSSTLDNKILTSLFKTEHKKSFGSWAIFKDLIEELNYLETTGINVTVNNEENTIYFTLGLIIGDNLGLHSILGFTESFVATYPCRFCKSTKYECHLQTIQNDNRLRNYENYEIDATLNDASLNGI